MTWKTISLTIFSTIIRDIAYIYLRCRVCSLSPRNIHANIRQNATRNGDGLRFVTQIGGLIWSQLSQFSQLLQSITIVATPTTIVVTPTTIAILINHKYRHTNHKCRNFFKTNYCLFHINFVSNFDIPSNFQQSLLHFSQLNYENCEILWHTIRLCHSCHNFDIEIVTVCEILEILATSQGKIATFVTTQFFDNEVDEIICGQWDCQQTDHR